MAKSKKKAPSKCGEGYRRVSVKSGGRKHTVCAISGKSGLAKVLAEKADHGLQPAQVKHVLNALATVAKSEVGKGAPFQIPGVVNLRVDHKKARKARTMDNPFKPGEKMRVKAKKAHNVVKARPVAAMKSAAK
jgi:nucleoid DNA-binding protein